VGTVAERTVLRLTAAAQSNYRLVGWQCERLALMIEESEFAFDHERTIGTATNGNRHESGPLSVDGFLKVLCWMRCWDYHAEARGVKWLKKQT
jgi:hypothetical protein